MAGIELAVLGIGAIGPGFNDWPELQAVLAGQQPWDEQRPCRVPVAQNLPPAERRRVGQNVRLALAAGIEAVGHSGLAADILPHIFTSSSGDGDNCHVIFDTLASADRQISPTRFHNSVHNAAAGYWGIAHGCQQASTSVCAYDASFSAGLLEAASQVAWRQGPVLLVSCDCAYPQPLQGVRPMLDACALALVLGPRQSSGKALAHMQLGLGDEAVSLVSHVPMQALQRGNPTARALPLLQALSHLSQPASAQADKVVLEYLAPHHLWVQLDAA